MPVENQKIKKKYLILCEGKDAQLFLISYLNSEFLKKNRKFSEDIQVLDFGGNIQLHGYLKVLSGTDGFDDVNRLLVVRDAEKNVSNAEREVQNALKKNALPIPMQANVWTKGDRPVTGYTLFPSCSANPKPGTLEDLCLKILSEDNCEPILGEIQTFIRQLKTVHKRKLKWEFKSKLHTYFSVTDKYVTNKLGEAARDGAFDWGSCLLRPLETFIESGFGEI